LNHTSFEVEAEIQVQCRRSNTLEYFITHFTLFKSRNPIKHHRKWYCDKILAVIEVKEFKPMTGFDEDEYLIYEYDEDDEKIF